MHIRHVKAKQAGHKQSAEDVQEVLSRLCALKVRGIRQILNYKPDWPRNGFLGELLENASWRRGFGELKGFDFSFDLQLNPHQFMKAAELLAAHPETPVIIDHLGSPTLEDLTERSAQYWQGLEAIAAQPQSYMKISMLSYIHPAWDEQEVVLEPRKAS